ncbi:histidine kinase [Schaalia cardiffensis]|uniref:histidine kinase n=1 Tax=Schaalia cardiffensis TaxID=181487 RepID=UPI0018E7D523|nr:histidine kinase [Schaalia cardiffensis]MBJ2328997.1 histidine kinase [Schaalia cardiffensis]
MSSTSTDPITIERVAKALETIGLFPFLAGQTQIAAILPNRTIRIVLPEGSPAQGVAEYPRRFHACHRDTLSEVVRTFNATTYVPKAALVTTEEGMLSVRFFHCFNWVVGATDTQIKGEISQFILSCIAVQNRLDEQFVDPWAKEAPNA